MIYIFDDKKNRQEGYMWTNERFTQYTNQVRPIYQYSEVRDEAEREKIFSDGNTILFHESFFDADFNRHLREADEIRQRLEIFAQSHPSFYLAFFSGSKSGRLLTANVAYLPVSIVYQNLEAFINETKNGHTDLKYLLYGKHPNLEKELVEKLNAANNVLEINDLPKIKKGKDVLIARTNTDNRLHQIVEGAYYNMSLGGDSDEILHEATTKHLQERNYEKIFIPLCFGSSLSDFNGLRLAAHIRCTETINQYTPVYIYSFVAIDEIINHECFDILKTRNVYLIDYTVSSFSDAINSNPEQFELAELSHEIAKLKLDVPKNYEDSHSIANEWAIYRWSKAINSIDSAIDRITEKVKTQLYFKYLSTIYPLKHIPEISQKDLQLENMGQPRILYIDDDADKGWYEILCKILSDINKIEHVDYLGDELKKISQGEIIEKVLSKIKKDNIDIVILDFRLHPNDFTTANIYDVTGDKLLREIKKINQGIQIIIFSATNKVWNLQALSEPDADDVPGADGFIVKESPENSIDVEFTKKAITGFTKIVSTAFKMTFLKEVWLKIEEIKSTPQFEGPRTDKEAKFSERLNDNLNVSFKLLTNVKYSEKYFSYAYLQLFQIIEDFSSLPSVFESDKDSYVFVKGRRVLVRKDLGDQFEFALKFEDRDGKYKLGKNIGNKKGEWVNTNSKVSAIIIFRLGQDSSSYFKWTEIYTNRNKKAAHFSILNLITPNDIYTILAFIKNFINVNNQDEKNVEKGLKEKTMTESIDILKKKFQK